MQKIFYLCLTIMVELVVLTAVIFGSSGCSRFTTQYAIIDAYNNSSDNAVIVVNATMEKTILAHQSLRFEVPILVPANPVSSQGGPSSVDKPVEMSIAFKNLRTGRLTFPAICRAGAKVITTVSYRVYSGNDLYDYAPQCTSSY